MSKQFITPSLTTGIEVYVCYKTKPHRDYIPQTLDVMLEYQDMGTIITRYPVNTWLEVDHAWCLLMSQFPLAIWDLKWLVNDIRLTRGDESKRLSYAQVIQPLMKVLFSGDTYGVLSWQATDGTKDALTAHYEAELKSRASWEKFLRGEA